MLNALVSSILQKEKLNNLPSRFPCRAIMVNTVEQYCQLLSELKKISDIRVVKTNEIFSSADVMPVSYTHLDVYKRQIYLKARQISVPFRLRSCDSFL